MLVTGYAGYRYPPGVTLAPGGLTGRSTSGNLGLTVEGFVMAGWLQVYKAGLSQAVDDLLPAVQRGDVSPDVLAAWVAGQASRVGWRGYYCSPCVERRLIHESEFAREGGDEMTKVIKVNDSFYEKIKAIANNEDKSMAEVISEVVPAAGQRAAFEDLRKECAEELGVPVAADPAWEERMLQVIPPGFSKKLDAIRDVYACALDKLLPESEVAAAEALPGEAE